MLSDPPTGRVFGGCLRTIPWLGQGLAPVGDAGTTFVAAMAPPGEGWGAFFIEFTLDPPVPGAPDLVITTPVSVVPRTLPFADCSGDACPQHIV